MAFVDPVRLCKPCSEITKVEADFFNNDIKTLSEGAPFHVTTAKSPATTPESPDLSDDMPKLYICKLTSDQRCLIFHEHDDDKEELNLGPIEVGKIMDMQPILDEKNQGVSMCIRVKSGLEEELSLRLDSPPEPSRKPSIQWLSAFRKVLFYKDFKVGRMLESTPSQTIMNFLGFNAL